MTKSIGTRVRSGESCPQTGAYLVEGLVGHTAEYQKGEIMQNYGGVKIFWVLYHPLT